MLETILHNQGLSERETALYLHLLKLGGQAASQLARLSGISRSGCYLALESLRRKGLVNQIGQNGTTVFHAVDPSLLLEEVSRQRRHELKQIDALKLNLSLAARGKTQFPAKSAAHYYQGSAGLGRLCAEIFNSSAPVLRLYLCNSRFGENSVLEQLSDCAARPTAASASATGQAATPAIKILLPAADTATDQVLPVSPSLRLPKKLPAAAIVKKIAAAFDLGIELAIAGDRLAIFSSAENFGLLIESPLIANALARVFDLGWRVARSR
jgi:predicted transcriptional regulator